jgi:hypothetical protein
VLATGRAAASTAKPPPMQVWKSPTCGCCNDWIAILQAEGFSVKAIDEGNTAARQRLGIPAKLRLVPHRADRRLRGRRPCAAARDPPAAQGEARRESA